MAEAVWNGHTQGMTIRDILEKVDLFNVSVLNSNQKGTEKQHLSKDTDGKTIIKVNDPSSAYLGPKLWDKQISLDLGLDLDSSADEGAAGPSGSGERNSGDASGYGVSSGMSPGFAGISIQGSPKERARSTSSDLQVMNMEEFLAENGLSLDIGDSLPINEVCSGPSVLDYETSPQGHTNINKTLDNRDVKPAMTRPNVIMNVPKVERQVAAAPKRPISAVLDDTEDDCDGEIDDPVPNKKPSNEFLYAESKRARLEREKAEKKRKFELELEFAPEDLALATVPGAQFDPSTRTFDVEELRPQPIIRKRKRIYVPDDAKDEKYWNCRIKNNVAARRSREARRLKENQIALRAAYLEKENRVLKQELDDVKFENTKLATERDILKMKLAKFEQMM